MSIFVLQTLSWHCLRSGTADEGTLVALRAEACSKTWAAGPRVSHQFTEDLGILAAGFLDCGMLGALERCWVLFIG